MTSRADRAKAAGESAGALQIRNFAFNLKGHAMKDALTKRPLNQVITTRYIDSWNIQRVIQVFVEKNIQNFYRNDMELTDEELHRVADNPSLSSCLIVGYAAQDHDAKWDSVIKKASRDHGTTVPSEAVDFDKNQPPYYVVTPLTTIEPEALKYYALLDPRDGLCLPCTISQSKIFWRWEFRTNLSSVTARVKAVDAVVKKVIVLGETVQDMSSKQLKFRCARKDGWPITFDPKISLSDEITSLALMFDLVKDKCFLEEMSTILTSIDDELNYRPPSANRGLRAFCEEKELTDEQAASLVLETKESWPSMEFLSSDMVIRMKRGLREGGGFLPYRGLGAFLKESAHIMNKSDEMSDADVANMTKEVIATANRMLPEPKSKAVISTDQYLALLDCLKAKLQEIQMAGLTDEEKLRAGLGDSSIPGTPAQIWKRFADAPDTDAAGNALMQQVKLIHGYVRQNNKGMRDMIGEIVLLLEKLLERGSGEK